MYIEFHCFHKCIISLVNKCICTNLMTDITYKVLKPSISTQRTTQLNQFHNQEHIQDSRSLLSNSKTQLENVRSLANAHNNHEVRSHKVSSNTQTTSHKVITSVKMPAQLSDKLYGIEELVQTWNATFSIDYAA
nr:BV-like protein [Cotesia vestalis bracovirus]